MDKISGKPRPPAAPPPPPPPKKNRGWESGAFYPARGFILDLGDGGLLFHFILSEIAV